MDKTPPTQRPVKDYTYFYSDLAFMPDGYKESKVWMAQMLFFAKMNAIRFLDPKRAKNYRKLENLEIDRQVYVNMIDPITPLGGGGEAKYFASDFKDFPIGTHLKNIVRAKLDKIGITNKIQVSEIDKFAKSQRQIDKDKIIYAGAFRELIKGAVKELKGAGLPPISDTESPHDYVSKLSGKDSAKTVDDISKLIDQIRLQIKDSQSFALYDRYVYKGDIERAFELGIEHYLINLNKWRIKSEFFTDDLMNFNKACGRWYIDQTTGRGLVEYYDPARLFTSPFKDKDGGDIMYFFYEKDITFAEFVRQFGTTLSDEQLKKVFLNNKAQHATHGQDWRETATRKRNNAAIRVGYFSVLSQDANNFAESYIDNRTPSWDRKPLTWQPDETSGDQEQKIYNVWYSCYYVPPPGNMDGQVPASWAWQSDYIFDIQKDIDMFRYGPDQRYARPTLVIYKDERPSFTDIMEAFMPKIRTTWHKFQNCIVQDTTAVVIDWDFIGAILNATDEANNTVVGDKEKATGGNGINAGLEMFKMIRQGGMGFMKFRDKNGNIIPGLDPSKFFVNIDTKHIERAEKYLASILQQYELLKIALAKSDVTEGQQPKPRTPVEGIKASVDAGADAMWYLEKPTREFTIMYGERCVQMILNFVKDKKVYNYTKRWQEFEEVIGLAQALMVKGLEDIEPECIGLTVSLEDVQAMQEWIFAQANELAKNRMVSYESVGLVIDTLKYNWKYAYALLLLGMKEKEREAVAKEDLEFQRQSQLQQQQMQIALTLQGAKSQGVNTEIATKGDIDARLLQLETQLKTNSLIVQKDQLNKNRLEEIARKAEAQKDLESHKKNLELQTPFAAAE